MVGIDGCRFFSTLAFKVFFFGWKVGVFLFQTEYQHGGAVRGGGGYGVNGDSTTL